MLEFLIESLTNIKYFRLFLLQYLIHLLLYRDKSRSTSSSTISFTSHKYIMLIITDVKKLFAKFISILITRS